MPSGWFNVFRQSPTCLDGERDTGNALPLQEAAKYVIVFMFLSTKSAAFAIAAHPDDIEFYMAGTLWLLKKAGYAIHYMTLASGSCGSIRTSAAATRALRRRESRRAARILGAH